MNVDSFFLQHCDMKSKGRGNIAMIHGKNFNYSRNVSHRIQILEMTHWNLYLPAEMKSFFAEKSYEIVEMTHCLHYVVIQALVFLKIGQK